MKAIRIHAFGGPEVVTYEDIPQPVPKAHEVLFKVTSTCVNYADWQCGWGITWIEPCQQRWVGKPQVLLRQWDQASPPCRWDSPSWPGRLVAMQNTPLPTSRTSFPAL